jgi:hypothetical protein
VLPSPSRRSPFAAAFFARGGGAGEAVDGGEREVRGALGGCYEEARRMVRGEKIDMGGEGEEQAKVVSQEE